MTNMHIIVKISLLSLSWWSASANTNTRIIGGRVTNERRYPYAVALTKGGDRFFCGGSLIARDVVLTARHCLGGSYNVAIGRHNLTSSNTAGDEVPILEEIGHPLWDKYTDVYDFALVILSRPTTIPGIPLVKINSDSSLPQVGSSARTMGWGDTAQDDDLRRISDVLMAVDVEVISNNECRNAKGTEGNLYNSYKDYIYPSMLCTHTPGKDACQGDS